MEIWKYVKSLPFLCDLVPGVLIEGACHCECSACLYKWYFQKSKTYFSRYGLTNDELVPCHGTVFEYNFEYTFLFFFIEQLAMSVLKIKNRLKTAVIFIKSFSIYQGKFSKTIPTHIFCSL